MYGRDTSALSTCVSASVPLVMKSNRVPFRPWNLRSTHKATLWPSKDPNGKPLYIPANTKTPYSVFIMHRRKDLWGPDGKRSPI
jgi:hypothetical protein